ncbi:transposase, partial [Aliarcobacter butzleri]|uniref:transposase n=1 Tax=Aliarcobacter butzleri TaxID=28197 RepID=UPI00186728DF
RINFDFNEVLEQFKNGKNLTGKDGLLAPLIKQLTEATLEAEVESHIANDVLGGKSNRRNSFNSKTIKGTSDGSFLLETPRDRNGTFEPQIVKKHQTTISNEIEEKILPLSIFDIILSDCHGIFNGLEEKLK